MLLAGEDHFHGHLRFTTRALSAWVVTGRAGLAKNAVGLEAIRIISAAEMDAVRRMPLQKPDITTDFVARVGILGPQFFEKFYYSVGGMRMLGGVSSAKQHRLNVRRSEDILGYLIDLTRIFHFYSDNMSSTTHADMSMNKGCEALDKLRQMQGRCRPPEGIRTALSPYAMRGSLLYAASTIVCGDRGTLLSLMQNQTLRYVDLKPNLEEWLGRARYVTNSILSKAVTVSGQNDRRDFDLQRTNQRLLPDGPERPFALSPPISPEIQQTIQDIFIKKKRGPKPRRLAS